MREAKKHFLQILEIEMEDLREDLQFMIKQCELYKKKKVLSDRVVNENIALYKNELLGVNEFEHIIRNTDYNAFDDLDSEIVFLRSRFQEVLEIRGFAEVVNICIKRKFIKVAEYIQKQ